MRTRRGNGARDDGVAVVLVALMVIPLVLFAALGVDVAAWHSRVSSLQKAADAAATAGAVWMPNLDKATTVSEESLEMNGIVSGVDDVTVTITEGATATSLRVEITDHNADRYLSRMVSGDQEITRFAEAEYFLPLPLGSPLNYFGGDSGRTALPITWPTPYNNTGRPPANASGGCNVGTASAQGLGRWTSTTAYSSTTFSGTTQCQWTVATTLLPVAPTLQLPTNVPCNVTQSPTSLQGRWNTSASDAAPGTYSANRHSSGTGNRQCTWAIPDTATADFATRAPVVTPCNVSGALADGRWQSATVHAPDVLYRDPSTSNRLCQWTPNTTTTTNPIDATRSPGLWAQIHGPGGDSQSGDAYSTRCKQLQNASCVTPDNDLYVDAGDPNQGIWYVLKAPANGGGPTRIRVFDASLLTGGGLTAGTGDSAITSASSLMFSTSYRVYKQTNPLDFNVRTALGTGSGDTTPGSCHWSLRQEATFWLQWADLCTVNMQPGDTYLVNVRTTAVNGVANSAGRNSYALEALTNDGAGVQPALYAYNKMVMYNNVPAGGAATFYVAEVSPAYAGKTLVLELYDPGESSADAWLYPMMPSPSLTGAVVNPASASCAFSSTRAGFPRASDLNNGGVCSVRTTDAAQSTPALYNNHWVTIRVTIPSDYTCTVGLNPVVSTGSCWWGIRYSFNGAANDATTWQARVEGNPVHVTQ